MSNANTVSVVFGADGTAYIKGVEQVNRSMDSLVSRTKETVAQLKANWLEVVAVIYTLKKAWDFAEQAANFQQAEQAFANLAASHGANSRQIISDLQQASAQAVATVDLMKSAGTAILLGIPVEQLSKMMEIARASSRITGQSIQKSFEDIGLGAARQSRLILDNLGIIVKVDKAYDNYARTLGKTAGQLTEAEQKQAFMNAVMLAGEDTIKRVNIQNKTAAEHMQTFVAALKDVGIVIGKMIITPVSAVIGVLAGLATGLNTWLASLFDTLAWMVRLGEKIPYVGSKFKGLSDDLADSSKYMARLAEASKKLSKDAFDVAAGIWKETEAIKTNTNAQNDNAQVTIATIEQKMKLIEAERQLAEAGRRATLEDLKNAATLELAALDREYEQKDIKAGEYYARKRAIENRAFEESKAQIMDAIATENQLAEAKLKALSGQPVEVIQAAEVEHANKLIDLAQAYGQIKSEQEQEELKNIYGLLDAERVLAAERFAAAVEAARLKQESPYQDNLKNYQGDNELVKDQQKYQEKLALLQDYNTQVIQAMVTAGATEDQIKSEYSALSTQYAKKERDARISYAADTAAAASNFMQNMMIATGSHSKAMFKTMQSLAIAHAIISGIEAAQDAWKWGMKIAGPPGAAIFAAASVAATAARIRQIADTKPEGATSSISEGGTANPSYSGGSPSAYPPVQPVQDVNQKQPLVINIHVAGNVVDHDAFARELVPSITKAISDGVH